METSESVCTVCAWKRKRQRETKRDIDRKRERVTLIEIGAKERETE